MKPKNEPQNNNNNQNYAKLIGFGIEFCGVLAVFCYFGYKLDQYFHTTGPWLLLAGFFIGFLGMFYILFKETWNIWRK